MSLSAISGRRASEQGEVVCSSLGPTPVTSGHLLNIGWTRIWESLLRSGEVGSGSVFLAQHQPIAGAIPMWRDWVGTGSTALTTSPQRTEPNWTVITFGALRSYSRDPAAAFVDLVADVGQPVMVFEVKRPSNPAQVVSQIRDWTELSATDVAALLGVSRRSLYHWLGSGRMSSENRERLSEIADALRPLVREWRPVRLRSWLRRNRSEPARLLRAGSFAAFRRLAQEALAEAAVPVRSARRLVVSEPEPPEYAVGALSPEQRRVFFDALLEPRPTANHEPQVPRELADSLPTEDE